MWDYDKLFADGNIIGIKDPKGIIYKKISSLKERHAGSIRRFCNDSLNFNAVDGEHFINWIIRLDEHGNVIEKLFDREKDMPAPMPKLKTGMFGLIGRWYEGRILSYNKFVVVDNLIIYQNGSHDFIPEKDIIIDYSKTKEDKLFILELYENCKNFNSASRHCSQVIWRNPAYEKYLNFINK